MNPSVVPLKLAESDYEDTRVDVYGYLVTAGDKSILVDTGIGRGDSYIEEHFNPTRFDIDKILATHGLETQDLGFIINSHLHFDHCGNNQLFTNARVLVQARELEAAAGTNYTIREWYSYEGASVQAVHGSTMILPGIQLISTPGHTPGHQSVLVESISGNILIAAQAAYTSDEFLRGGDPSNQAHEGFESAYVQSITKLKSLSVSKIYFSHDGNPIDFTRGESVDA